MSVFYQHPAMQRTPDFTAAADGGGEEWVVKKGGVAKVRIDLRHTAGK